MCLSMILNSGRKHFMDGRATGQQWVIVVLGCFLLGMSRFSDAWNHSWWRILCPGAIYHWSFTLLTLWLFRHIDIDKQTFRQHLHAMGGKFPNLHSSMECLPSDENQAIITSTFGMAAQKAGEFFSKNRPLEWTWNWTALQPPTAENQFSVGPNLHGVYWPLRRSGPMVATL